MSADLAKKQLRQKILRQRNSLTPARQKAAAAGCAIMLAGLARQLFKAGQPLHLAVYAAMRKELDLAASWPLWQAWPA